MTSPSETPLDDFDIIRFAIAHGEGLCSALDSSGLADMRDYRIFEDGHAALTRLQSRPRTVGDLTARDLGRRVRIGDEFNGPLDPALFGAIWMFDLDTPVEFLDDEPANDHQRPGEHFPSHERAAQVLEGDARAEDAQEGRP